MDLQAEDSEDDLDYEPGARNGESAEGRSANKRKRADSHAGGPEGADGGSFKSNGSVPGGSARATVVADPLAQLKADAKKSKINAIWEQLKGTGKASLPGKSAQVLTRQVASSGATASQKGSKGSSMPSWMLNLGLAKPGCRPKGTAANGNAPAVSSPSSDSAAAAASGKGPDSNGGSSGPRHDEDESREKDKDGPASTANQEGTGVRPREANGGEEAKASGRAGPDSQLSEGLVERREAEAAEARKDGEGEGARRGSASMLEDLEEVAASSRAVAAAALVAAKAAAAGATAAMDGKLKVTEVRDFAGQAVEVTRLLDPHSKEAQAAKRKADMQASSAKGLDAMLAQLEKKKKLNILDKSRKDWGEYKEETGVTEELESFKKSGGTYTEKVAFLSRADVREYEKEREARLAAQARRRT